MRTLEQGEIYIKLLNEQYTKGATQSQSGEFSAVKQICNKSNNLSKQTLMNLKNPISPLFPNELPSLEEKDRQRNGSKSPQLINAYKLSQITKIGQYSPRHSNSKKQQSAKRQQKNNKAYRQLDILVKQDTVKRSHNSSGINRPSQLAVNGLQQNQSYRKMQKNKSEMLQPKRKNNKLILDKFRNNQQPLTNHRYHSNARVDQDQNPKTYFQNDYGDENLKQHHHHLSSELIKSRNKIKSLKQNTKNNSLITLSTIKQKIQRYLSEEESKLKQINKKNMRNDHHKPVLYEKDNLKLKIAQQNYQPILKAQGGVFKSLSSLTRKKQTKFALDMMKRRLNFSVVNRSIKEREVIDIKNRDNRIHTKRRSLNEEQSKKQIVADREYLLTEDISAVASNALSMLENEPEGWNQLQKQMIEKLGYKLRSGSSGNSQELTQAVKIPFINAIPSQYQGNCRSSVSKVATQQTRKSSSKQTKGKQYLYNLYYNPTNKDHNSPYKSPQQNCHQQVQKYKDWTKHNITQENLNELLKQHTDPIDPIECYYDAFMNKPSSLQSLKPFPSTKHSPRPFLYNSNSSSNSPLGKQKKYRMLTQMDRSNPESVNQKIDQRIIFVTKQQRKNLQHKKLSNLLSKIQKRNSEIQRLGYIHAVEIFQSTNKHKNTQVNGLNIQDYIEENLTLYRPRQDKTLNNFIVQWPKKQQPKQKQKQVPKKVAVKKENPDDWTVFEPWKDAGTNEHEFQGPYKKASERRNCTSFEEKDC